ncbi:MAG: hypothetical protein WBJ81_05805 [Rickettsiales bacterium]
MSLTSKSLNLQQFQELNITDVLINNQHNNADSRVGDIILGVQNNIVENPEHKFLRGGSRDLSDTSTDFTNTDKDIIFIGLCLVGISVTLAKLYYCPNHADYTAIANGDSWYT